MTASSQVREVWSSWTIAPVWTGCSCGAVCSGTATSVWRRSASRLRWRLCQALVRTPVYNFALSSNPGRRLLWVMFVIMLECSWLDPGILRLNVKMITPRPYKKNHCPAAHVAFPALSRLGYAGGLLRLHSAALGGGQEAHGEHARLLLWHQRAATAAALPWRHRPHRWEGNNVTSTHSNRTDFSRYFQKLTHSSTCLVPLHWCCYVSIIFKC